MKLQIIFLSLFLFSSDVFTQTEVPIEIEKQTTKGTFSLAGEIYYSYSSSNGNSFQQMLINPNVGYFVGNNVLLGLDFIYNYLKFENSEGHSFVGIGPFLEIYLGKNINQVFFRVGISSGISEGISSSTFSVALGYNIAIAKNVALQPAIQYGIGETSTLMLGLGVRNFIF